MRSDSNDLKHRIDSDVENARQHDSLLGSPRHILSPRHSFSPRHNLESHHHSHHSHPPHHNHAHGHGRRGILSCTLRILAAVLFSITLIHIVSTIRSTILNPQSPQDAFSLSIDPATKQYQSKDQPPTTYYEDCLQSFKNRNHPLNDGVSVKIGVFSHWTKIEKRSQIRSTIKQWLPNDMNVDFVQYCERQVKLYRKQNGDDAFNALTRFIPATSSHAYWPDQPFGDVCSHGSKESNSHSVMLDRSWLSVYDNVQYVFVFGGYKQPNFTRNAVFERETTMYGDLEHLEIEEAINGGKSLVYLQTAARTNRKRRRTYFSSTNQYPWDYILKVDDDSFLHLPHYITQLREFRANRLPEVMYGQLLHYPHTPIPIPVDPSKMPMWAAGAGYTLGADLVDWLITAHFGSVRARLRPVLPDEDLVLGEWFRLRGEDLGRDRDTEWTGRTNNRDEGYRRHPCLCANFVNMMPRIYNYPGDALTWSWSRQAQFHPLTVIVHYVKKPEWWQTTTEHFMCGQPHKFNWASNETWWKEKPWGELIYKFNDDGSLQYSHEFYDQFHQNYREFKDQQAGFIGEKAIQVSLGNVTR